MAKKLWIAYLLYFLGGGVGLHLFYLHRDRQALLWLTTCGGFIMGLLRDLFVIPRYVAEASESPDESSQPDHFVSDSHSVYPLPPLSILRVGAAGMFGWMLASLFQYCIPGEWMEFTSSNTALVILTHCLGPIGSSLGVYLVSNIGKEKCLFSYPFYTSAVVSSLYILFQSQINLVWVALVSAIVSLWRGRQMRTKGEIYHRNKRGKMKRFIVLTVLASIYVCLLLSTFYFNASVTTEDGEEIKVRDAIQHFFQSELWANTKQVLWQLYERYKLVGWSKMWTDFVSSIDPEGESHAQKVLNLGPNFSESELRRSYKLLARQWHPDKNKGNKEYAEKKFMEIQSAYETLSKIHARRSKRWSSI